MLKALSRSELEDALKLAMSNKDKGTVAKRRARPVDNDVGAILSALSGRHRLAILDLLRAGPLPARQIAETLDLHRANFSRYLKELADAGLVSIGVSRLDARERIVSLRREPLDILDDWVQAIRTDAATSSDEP